MQKAFAKYTNKKSMKSIIILAGNRAEYLEYCQKKNLDLKSVIFGDKVEDMWGYTVNKIAVVGSFNSRPDASKLLKFARARLIVKK